MSSTHQRLTAVALSLVTTAFPSFARAAGPGFSETKLVSSAPGDANHQDSDLVNAWGVAIGADAYFWVADNGTGKSTLYTASGLKSALVVTLPNPTSAELSKPTGQVYNPNGALFSGDSFIFDTEEGTIIGWNGGSSGVVRADRSSAGAVYKGLALAKSGGATFLYAADFHNAQIDVFDASYNFVPAGTAGRFVDPGAPAGYAPFNIHLLRGKLYVAYAKQDSGGSDEVAGPGNGFVSVFKTDGTFVRRLVTGSSAGGKVKQLDAPWGLAIAPPSFGPFGGDVLVANFGSGRISAFNARGKFAGYVSSKSGKPIVIPGLWEIIFGNGRVGDRAKLYFSAGPDDESGGLFGYVAVGKAGTKQTTPHHTPTPQETPTQQPTQHPTPVYTPTPYPTYVYPDYNY